MKFKLSIFLLFFAILSNAQTFTFQCFDNAKMTGDSCDICPNTVFQSRSFSGLMIYRNGVEFRWIDEPYLIRLRPSDAVEFIEQAVSTPDKITISLQQTPYSTINGFIDSTFCKGALSTVLFYATDSTDIAAINTGDTLTIVGHGATTVTFDSLLQKYIVYTPISSGTGTLKKVSFTDANVFTGTVTNPTTTPNITIGTSVNGLAYGNGTALAAATIGSGIGFSSGTITATDPSPTNENLTIVVGANSENLGGQTLNVTGTGIATPTYNTGTNTLNIAATEVDGSTTNELQNLSLSGQALGISSGTGVTLPIIGITAGTGISVSTSSGTATVINTGDLSTTNELQTLSVSANTATLSNSGGSVTIAGGGINSVGTSGTTITVTGTEVDGNAANEGLLGVSAGTATTSVITSNTTGANGVTITAGNGLNIVETTSANGGTIILGINGGSDPWVLGGNTLTVDRTIGSNNNFKVGVETNGTTRMSFNSVDGKIGVGNTAPQVAMDFDGHTDGVVLPGGSIAQRPNVTRVIRWNTAFQGIEAINGSGSYVPISATTGMITSTGPAVQGTGLVLSVLREDITGVAVNVTCGNNPQNNAMVLRLTYGSAIYSRQPTVVVSAAGQQSAGLSFWSQSGGAGITDIYVLGTLVSGLTYPIHVTINP